ncbi:lipocalin-like domain protein [Dyella monticola]|uniref:Lipocalin-like domain protein n=1 Tax=Dyella monticola TaxID=1927958 RepID=A0A370X1K9_9GAMM|nr:lipocalin-like domain-containing protein [Dyella monticola]RDS82289.1 lipocalin-like domain protein [Dyella monticola]
MNVRKANTGRIMAMLLGACALWSSTAIAGSARDMSMSISSLAGTWTLVAADVQHPDGSRAPDFGAQPKGLLMVDNMGHYSLQIFKSERPAFRMGDKAKGTPDEYASAVKGSSTHYGMLRIDQEHHVLVFHIQGASFPNWEGQDQHRQYELKDGVLSYRVKPRPNGDVPISVWRKVG